MCKKRSTRAQISASNQNMVAVHQDRVGSKAQDVCCHDQDLRLPMAGKRTRFVMCLLDGLPHLLAC